ncbi:MAG TPA: sigma 54-interacting transcriptional regulator [Planctomycetota bacterium]|nr:sigma 54-interacting transcriptional regulator [Planctomycetota bacterium]
MSENERVWDLLRTLAHEEPRRAHFASIADGLLRACDGERIWILRFRPAGGFRAILGRNIDGEDLADADRAVSHFALKRLEEAGEVWVVPEARSDVRYRTEEFLDGSRPAQSILVLALRAGDTLSGAVYIDHRFRSFSKDVHDDTRVRAYWRLAEVALRLREHRVRNGGAARSGLDPRAAASIVAARDRSPSDDTPSVAPRRLDVVRGALREPIDLFGFVSANAGVLDLLVQIRQLAEADLPVLVVGETGIGKSLLAAAIHRASSRRDQPFESLPCGAIPDTLLDSELVGHKRGAFTGAEDDHPGLFRRAHRGTLLLDEVGELSPEAQTKLLRVLEDGRVRPLGGTTADATTVDVRIVATTRYDLEERVASGRFRADLFFRLKSAVVTIPPLRERPEDVLALADHFLARYTRRRDARFTEPALERLLRYSWPGNVRELENEIRRIAAIDETSEIGPEQLLPHLRNGDFGYGFRGVELATIVEEAERRAIADALRRHDGNKSRVAAELGITRKALYRRIRKYGLEDASPSPGDAVSG